MGLLRGGGLGRIGRGGFGKNLGKLGRGNLGQRLGQGKLGQRLGKGNGPLAKLREGGGLGQGKLAEAFQGIGGKLGEAFQQMGGVQGIMDMVNQFAGLGQGGGDAAGAADAGGQAGGAGGAGGAGDNPIARLIQALMQGGDPQAIDAIAAQLKQKVPNPQMAQLIDLFAGIGKQVLAGGAVG
jgi:hypothetical protein